jgi:hypothetical protein
MKCSICNAEVEGGVMQMQSHWGEHKVRPVSAESENYVLCLPDGCSEGRFEAAGAFADAYAELKVLHPDAKFHLLPFLYKNVGSEGESALTTILAIKM